MENSTGSPPLCTQPQIFWAVNLICSPPPANLTAQEGLRLSPHFRNCLWRETAGIVQLFPQIKETSGKEVLWACLGRGDFESAEGNCRGEGSCEGSAISRKFALRGAAAKQVGSKEITCGVHSRRGEGGSGDVAGNRTKEGWQWLYRLCSQTKGWEQCPRSI